MTKMITLIQKTVSGPQTPNTRKCVKHVMKYLFISLLSWQHVSTTMSSLSPDVWR